MKSKQQKDSTGSLHFRLVIKYIVWLCVFVIIAELVVGSLYAISTMKKEADFVVHSTKQQIDYRVENTISLLNSLVNDKFFTNPEISYTDKAKELDKFSASFNYMMICIVDKDFNVWDAEGSDANLAGRAYMQRMYATGEPQVTDSFAAGADGVTMNYTIAVPMYRNNKFDGCIFAAIYFDEIQQRLETNTYENYQQLHLFGSENQIMSVSDVYKYGETYMDIVENRVIFGDTVKQVEENMFNEVGGSNWYLDGGRLEYEAYTPIKGTNWTLACQIDFFGMFAQYIPKFLGVILSAAAACAVLVMLANRYIESQMATVEMLVSSVQDLEKKIYQNEKPDNVDFREIISLTSKGLTDGLTGVITRTVFLNQVPFKIKALKEGELAAMCFVDVDNLKTINDTYGHNVGDMTLKSTGYVLREYEKKYDGLVGRHGGDEFIVLLMGFKTEAEITEVVSTMTARMHSEVTVGQEVIPTQCSVGAAVCDSSTDDCEALIKQADKMLYYVKQHGKGSYKIQGK